MKKKFLPRKLNFFTKASFSFSITINQVFLP